MLHNRKHGKEENLGVFEIVINTLAEIMGEEKNTYGFESDMSVFYTKCEGAYLALAQVITECPSQKEKMSDKCRETMEKTHREFRHNDSSLMRKVRSALKKHL